MPLLVLAFAGGMLTIFSPCILPVIPFVFARTGRPFTQSGLPLLVGMVVMFAIVATLVSIGGGWIVRANEVGRDLALAAMALVALSLLSTRIAELLSRPFVRLGNCLSARFTTRASAAQSFGLGVATGLLWAPCAGPILGLVLTGAALEGPRVGTFVLLLAYAAGAAVSLSVAILVGDRLLKTVQRTFGAEEWIRRGIGVAVLVAVVALAFGLDRGLLTSLSAGDTSRLEQGLIDRLRPMPRLSDEGTLPALGPVTLWLNSPALTPQALRGKVVLIDFWTYSCINCLRTLPYVKAWDAKYRSQGLVVIGVHTPEFAFEKEPANVRKALSDLGITYPVALDNDYHIWHAFNNTYWPAEYLIDAHGRIRHHHFGEGDYDSTERAIQELLRERNGAVPVATLVRVRATGVERAADFQDMDSPETYLGYARTDGFTAREALGNDVETLYHPQLPALNQWSLDGRWTIGADQITLNEAPGRLLFRFHSRDVHIVLGPDASGKAVRFRVLLDGKAPAADAGVDIDAHGDGIIREQRLYQIVRQQPPVVDRTIEIEFLDPGVQAYSFTFG